LDLKQQYPHAKLVVGNTGGQVGMHVYCKMSSPSSLAAMACTGCDSGSSGLLLVVRRDSCAASCDGLVLDPPLAEVGIEMKFKQLAYPVLIGSTHIPELNAFEVSM
jgi:hypothetical protein